jgi:hypothetical protein
MEFAIAHSKKKWKPSIGFPKKEHKKESITQCSLFFSAKPACSLRFPIAATQEKLDEVKED